MAVNSQYLELLRLIAVHNPFIFVLFGRFRAGKSTFIENTLQNPNLNISGLSLNPITQVSNYYWSSDMKNLFIDTPGYGVVSAKTDEINLNQVNDFLTIFPYISNYCIMISMPMGIGFNEMNIIKLCWEIADKRQDISFPIIFTGPVCSVFNHQDIIDDFDKKILEYDYKLKLKYKVFIKQTKTTPINDVLIHLKTNSSNLNAKVSQKIICHTNQIVQKNKGIIQEYEQKLQEVKDYYFSKTNKQYIIGFQNETVLFGMTSTIDDEVKEILKRIQYCRNRIIKIEKTNLDYTIFLNRCSAIATSTGLQCQKTINCPHHKSYNLQK